METRSRLVIFTDTNVLVQGRPLHTLPWDELGRDPIEVVLCGPVIRELDRLKTKGGRAGRVARSISSTVRLLMAAADRSDFLRDAAPRVSRRLLLGLDARTPVREGLDVAHGDQAIINQALAWMDAGEEVLLLTDDNFAAMTAEEFGLPTMLLPPHWLREAEPDESAREIARRDLEIARLKAAEPRPELRFVDADGGTIMQLEVTMPRHLPVPPETVGVLMDRIARLAPLADVRPSPSEADRPASPARRTGPSGFDISALRELRSRPLPVTEADVASYRADYTVWIETVRRSLADLHLECDRSRAWPCASLVITNSGSRPANDVLVEIEAHGRFELSGRARCTDRQSKQATPDPLPSPPAPPRPRPKVREAVGILSGYPDPTLELARLGRASTFPAQRDDDRFYWRAGRSHPVEIMQLECKVWRHGRGDDDFGFVVSAEDGSALRGLVVGRVSASNLAAPVEARLPLRITFEDRDTSVLARLLVDAFEAGMKASGQT